MKILKTIVLALLAGAVGGLLVFVLSNTPSKTHYVMMAKVYDECELKSAYEKELSIIEDQSNDSLQTIKAQIDLKQSEGTPTEQIKLMRSELARKRQVLSESYQRKQEAFEKMIWNQINQGVEAYGKEKQLDYILGATGSGTIMFAENSLDITEQVIEYINSHE